MLRLTDDEITRVYDLTEFFARLRWTDAPVVDGDSVPTPQNYEAHRAERWRRVFQNPMVVEARRELAEILHSIEH